MAKTLIYRTCPTAANGNRTEELYYDSDTKLGEYAYPTLSACSPYYIPENTLLDTYCDGTTKVEVFSKGTLGGRPERPPWYYQYTPNASTCAASTCGLKIDDVQYTETGGTYTITILTSGFTGAVEYSLNGFDTVQDSNIFPNLTPGAYTAVARPKR